MADIKRLLNKKGWTGKELGIIEVTNMAVNFRNRLQGKREKPLIEHEQFQKMLNELKDPVQGKIYNGYISLHEWITLVFNIAQGQLQQAQVQFRTLEGIIGKAIIAEDVFRFASRLPYIVTEKQYNDIKAERLEAYFKDEDGEELQSNIFNLVERAIAYYLNMLQTEPKKANPLKAIRKKYITQPVKSKLILDRYNEVTENGYYQLEDGRRSDKMTAEEWQEAIKTPQTEEALSDMQTYALHFYKEKARRIYEGATPEEAEAAIEKKDGVGSSAVWHNYTEPPKDLTKWDIIEQELLLDFYPASLDGKDPYNEDNFTASMKDFYNEFKELADAMLKDMDSKYFKGDEVQASKLKLSEWETTFISWRRLYELDFYGEAAIATDDMQTFDGNRRALFNGIAILRPSDSKMLASVRSRYIDEKGYYIEPELGCSITNGSLEGYFTEAEDYADNVEEIESSVKTFLDSYYFVLAFNYVVERIADIYEVPDLTVFILPIEKEIGGRMDAYNALVPILYTQIKDTDYRDKELQAKKMQVLKDYFQPVDYKALALPEENKEKLNELLKDFKAFKKDEIQDLVFDLMHRPQGEGADYEKEKLHY